MKTIKGDLIKLAEEGEFDMIVQGCNCFHTMGSGIAGQLAAKYPKVLEADKSQTGYSDREKLGTWSTADVGKFVVINAYTQYFFGLGTDVFEYEAFGKFLNDFRNMLETYDERANHNWKMEENGDVSIERIREFKPQRIGFPMIGAGLAGGDWNRISKMIEQFANDVKSFARVTVVEYQK